MDTERLNHASALSDSGRVQEALFEYEAMLNEPDLAADDRASLLHSISVCHYRLGDVANGVLAIEAAKAAVQDDALRFYIDLQEGVLLWKRGRVDEALAIFERLLNNAAAGLLPELRRSAQIHRAQLLIQAGRGAEAIPALRELYDEGIDKGNSAYFLGCCLLRKGELEIAERMFAEAVQNSPERSIRLQAHYLLGRTYLRLRQFTNAKEHLKLCEAEAAESGVSLASLFTALAEATKRLGELSESERYAQLAKKNE